MFKELSEAIAFCKENEVKMVDFKMIDLHGRWRHLTIPTERFTEEIFTSGIGFDGSNYGFAPVEKSDMIFIPDITTANIDPFMNIKTLSMIGDVYSIGAKENKRFEQDPRNVAKHAEEYLIKTGVADKMIIGPEFEFYVFDHVSYSVGPQGSHYKIDAEQAEWNTGDDTYNLGYKIPHKGGYHMTAPMDVLCDLRSRISLLMEERGIQVKYHHHEVGGPGQVEIEVERGSLCEMADKTMMTKYLIKNCAVEEGKTATFLPKPIYGEAGSGLHVHMHLFKEGKPVFYDENGYSGLSQEAHYFMGGLLRHVASLCAFTNPSTNSYRRLIPGYEAPVTIGYATSNRSAVIRIPAYAKTPDEKRFELRSPDGTCNPYYAYAAILMAGLDGIKNKIDPHKEGYGPYDMNLYDLPAEEKAKIKMLPKKLGEALDALERDHQYLLEGGVFSEKLIQIWIEHKRKEIEAYNLRPHPLEFAMYYDL
ncbi:MAG: type I glutamate--ammonia ligase [Clostridiales bacterium]|nr:type I glutamate--ammonia ligase [Clostridiales bacterium]